MEKKNIELPDFMKEYLQQQKDEPQPSATRHFNKYFNNTNLALLIFSLLIAATIYPPFIFSSRTSHVIISRMWGYLFDPPTFRSYYGSLDFQTLIVEYALIMFVGVALFFLKKIFFRIDRTK